MGDKEETTKDVKSNMSTCGWQTDGTVGEQVTTGKKNSHLLSLFLHYLGQDQGKCQGEKLSRKQRSISDMLCFPAPRIWIFNQHLCPCGHREWRESSLWSLLTNRATNTNLEMKSDTKQNREAAQGFRALCMSLCLRKRLGMANPPSAHRAKIGVKSRAKNISKKIHADFLGLYTL